MDSFRSGVMSYFLGLDLGQANAYSALAVLEKAQRPGPDAEAGPVSHYAVRYLRRWPPQTPYPDIDAELARLAGRPPLDRPALAIDQTGVGAAVVELFVEARPYAVVRPVVVTGGHAVSGGGDGTAARVPRRELAG